MSSIESLLMEEKHCSNGRVFSSSIESGSCVLRFLPVSELSGYENVYLSGTLEHYMTFIKEGRVFGRGSNEYGKLGLNKKTKSISSLLGYEIKAAGKILSFGSNCYGQLLLSSGPSEEKVYSPRETTITGGATFCIPGHCFSSVFVGGDPPPNTPNMPIQYHQ